MTEDKSLDPFDAIFGKFPDGAKAQIYAHEKGCGILIRWSMKGVGFGDLTIACNKETGKWHVDTEYMDPESCERILKLLDGTVVKTYPE